MEIKFIRLNNDNGETPKIPIRASAEAAGIDLAAFITTPIILKSFERVLVPTGLKIEIPYGYCGFLYARSSLGTKYGVSLSNGVGVIDSDFRGEIKVGLINLSNKDFLINNNDRIAQIVISKIELCSFTETNKLSQTIRNENGFGSTGK
ncbi:MAG: dUTP diphosphatase [Clostridia bacterium]